MSNIAEMFRVKGAVVGCHMCKNYELPFTSEPCYSCYWASRGSKSMEHAAFDPKDNEQLERVQRFVKRYSGIFAEMECDANLVGVPLDDLLKNFVPTRDIRDFEIK